MSILIVDDHLVVREGIKRLVADKTPHAFSEAANGTEALALFKAKTFDLVILDLSLPDISGFEVLKRMLEQKSDQRIIIFSIAADVIYARRAFSIGAKGYVSKTAGAEELLTAIDAVRNGGQHVEHAMAIELARTSGVREDPLTTLSGREQDILRRLAAGESLSAIAESIGVSYKTITNSVTAMKSKLNVRSTADLIRLAIEFL